MIARLLRFAREHEVIARRVARYAEGILGKGMVRIERRKSHTLEYLQKNVFSILFLSVYGSLGIPRERRIFYGMLNRCMRGLITAADNLLDDEYKGLLELRGVPEDATRYRSVLQILTFDRVLPLVVCEAAQEGHISPKQGGEILSTLFRKMTSIGAEEAVEEGGITDFLEPEEIIHAVHIHKGADLLKLSLVAPAIVENGLIDKIRLCERGIHEIGIGLQILDDVTDLCEDIRRKNHNYLVSSVYHRGDALERAALRDLLANPEDSYAASKVLSGRTLALVVNDAVEHAANGFSALHDAGHWLGSSQALRLTGVLFKARGLSRLWATVR